MAYAKLIVQIAPQSYGPLHISHLSILVSNLIVVVGNSQQDKSRAGLLIVGVKLVSYYFKIFKLFKIKFSQS